MSEASEKSEENDDYRDVVVKVGYSGEEQRVKFRGKKIAEATNKSYQGPNQNRWHNWYLYEVSNAIESMAPDNDGKVSVDARPAKYRVLDSYHTCWQGESGHKKLSAALTAEQVVRRYPTVVNQAIEDRALDPDDFTIPASDEEEAGEIEQAQ